MLKKTKKKTREKTQGASSPAFARIALAPACVCLLTLPACFTAMVHNAHRNGGHDVEGRNVRTVSSFEARGLSFTKDDRLRLLVRENSREPNQALCLSLDKDVIKVSTRGPARQECPADAETRAASGPSDFEPHRALMLTRAGVYVDPGELTRPMDTAQAELRLLADESIDKVQRAYLDAADALFLDVVSGGEEQTWVLRRGKDSDLARLYTDGESPAPLRPLRELQLRQLKEPLILVYYHTTDQGPRATERHVLAAPPRMDEFLKRAAADDPTTGKVAVVHVDAYYKPVASNHAWIALYAPAFILDALTFPFQLIGYVLEEADPEDVRCACQALEFTEDLLRCLDVVK